MTQHTQHFDTHLEAWKYWASLVEDERLNAEIVDGERGGYVVRWWVK